MPPPPRAAPLPSLAALLDWRPGARPDDVHCRASVGRRRRARRVDDGRDEPAPPPPPSVLIAHDLAGSYGPDAAPHGDGTPTTSGRPFYRFTAWNAVDAAVYFSHERVTLPPPAWTDGAHEAGAASLGTLIFEWEAGAADLASLAADPALAAAAAAALTELAAWFGFDGWLVNAEAAVAGARQAASVAAFVSCLDAAIARRIDGGRVIWYDALSALDGSLAWRNRLCARHNLAFFAAAASGGLWANYAWGTACLAASVDAARAAGRPPAHVWMGADAWGRGSHGGGGARGVATAAAAAAGAGASLAVFAPGWAWEAGEPVAWRVRDAALWAGVAAAYGPGAPAPMADASSSSASGGRAVTACFATTFATGAGRAWWEGGAPSLLTGAWAGPAGWYHAGCVDALPPDPALHAGWSAGSAAVRVDGGGRVRVSAAGLEAAVIAPDARGADAEAGWAAAGDGADPGAFQGGGCLAVRGSDGALAARLPAVAAVAVAGGWVAARAAAWWRPGTAAPRLEVVVAGMKAPPFTVLEFRGPGGGWVEAAAPPAAVPPGAAAVDVRLAFPPGAAAVDARLGLVSLTAGTGPVPSSHPPTLAAAAADGGPAAAGLQARGDGEVAWTAAAPGVRWWEVWEGGRLAGVTRAPRWRGGSGQEPLVVRARFVDGSGEGRR